MKNISTENKSIILSSTITTILFIIIFCASNFFINKNFINKTETPMGKENYIKVNLNQNHNDNLDKQKTKHTIQKNKKITEAKKENFKINDTYNKTSNITTTNNTIENNFSQTNEKQTPDIKKTSTENNSSEANSGIGNFHFYSIGTAKILTEDILDKKITENLYYPEKAKRRGIEGKVSIQIDISKTGELISYKIISKKSNPILEEASIMTLKKIFPIDEFQIKNAEENFSIIITLVYKLN